MGYLERRVTVLTVTMAIAIQAMLFSVVTFAPTAHGSQSPTLFIDIGSLHSFTAAQVFDYRLERLQFCFTIASVSDVRIIDVRSDQLRLEQSVSVGPFESAVICGRLSSEFFRGQTPTAEEVARSLVVTFDFGIGLNDCSGGRLSCDFRPGLRTDITFQFSGSNQFCFSVANHAFEPLTSLAFDLPGFSGPFALISINPEPQLSYQSLKFITDIERIPKFPNATPDFGVSTGKVFAADSQSIGILSFQPSSKFCVSGNLGGLNTVDLAAGIYVRFEPGHVEHVVCNAELSGCAGGSGGGLTGIASGSPR